MTWINDGNLLVFGKSVMQTVLRPCIADEMDSDVAAREALLDAAFGFARSEKTCERLREGRLPARGLSLVARCEDDIVGTLRMWHVSAGDVPALLLGPLAVAETHRSQGLGCRLVAEALWRAVCAGHKAVLLVGDAPYYQRFGFERRHAERLGLPGPVDERRFLGLELVAGVLKSAQGMVQATGPLDLRRHIQRAEEFRHAA